ncbi:hypothetical protein, partial [Brachyspira pulli]|uniref:hypothetical protein n=1 Tax=Brachyspira pulli TaxID=310721 RepID=UPI0030053934
MSLKTSCCKKWYYYRLQNLFSSPRPTGAQRADRRKYPCGIRGMSLKTSKNFGAIMEEKNGG